jgi:branched-chain amino acid transport system substrate-binding protein
MTRRWTIAIMISLILAVSAVDGFAAEAVKIGAVLPFTGDAAYYGQWMRQGMDIAIDEIRADWQGKRELTIIYEDSKTSPKDGVAAINKLVHVDKTTAVMTTLTGVTKALIPIAEQNKIILTTSATLPGLTDGTRYVFRNATNLGTEISRLVELAAGRYKQAGVLWVNLEWAKWGRTAFMTEFEKRGGKVVADESFDTAATDVRAQLAKIKAASPEVLLVLAYKTTGVALKQARELGIRSQFIGTLDFESPEVVQVAKEAAEGAVYTKAAFDPNQPASEATRRYVGEYRRRYKQDPEVYSATHYDMLKILATAAAESDGRPDGMREFIVKVKNYAGASGMTTFLPNGDVLKTVDLKTIKNGKYAPYAP